jgi:signal peptidase II
MGYILLVMIIFLGDLGLKNYAQTNLEEQPRRSSFSDRVLLRRYHNQGAFLNLAEKRPKPLLILSLIFTAVISIFFFVTVFHHGTGLLRLGLSFLLGGAFSNTYDRLKRGFVVDYVSFKTPFPSFNRMVFNVADFCIILGALLTVLGARN